jgi:citrate synthase
MSESIHVHKGLEGVIADTTAVSLVDGEAGRLYYRGYAVEALAGKRFAEVMHLIVFGELPDAERLDEVERDVCHPSSPRRYARSRDRASIPW